MEWNNEQQSPPRRPSRFRIFASKSSSLSRSSNGSTTATTIATTTTTPIRGLERKRSIPIHHDKPKSFYPLPIDTTVTTTNVLLPVRSPSVVNVSLPCHNEEEEEEEEEVPAHEESSSFMSFSDVVDLQGVTLFTDDDDDGNTVESSNSTFIATNAPPLATRIMAGLFGGWGSSHKEDHHDHLQLPRIPDVIYEHEASLSNETPEEQQKRQQQEEEEIIARQQRLWQAGRDTLDVAGIFEQFQLPEIKEITTTTTATDTNDFHDSITLSPSKNAPLRIHSSSSSLGGWLFRGHTEKVNATQIDAKTNVEELLSDLDRNLETIELESRCTILHDLVKDLVKEVHSLNCRMDEKQEELRSVKKERDLVKIDYTDNLYSLIYALQGAVHDDTPRNNLQMDGKVLSASDATQLTIQTLSQKIEQLHAKTQYLTEELASAHARIESFENTQIPEYSSIQNADGDHYSRAA
jgi:hypothetical protein